jgi:hypothetical protein
MQISVTSRFLDGVRVRQLVRDLASRDDFDDVCGLRPQSEADWEETKGRAVSPEEFMKAPEHERYFRLMSTRTWSYTEGQRTLDGGCPLTLAELAELLDYAREAARMSLSMIRVLPRRFLPSHFVGPHRDNRLGRVLTAYAFLTPDWTEQDGGGVEFIDHTGKAQIVPAWFNDFLLFDVRGHWLQSFQPVTGNRAVHCLQFWTYA